MNVELLDKVIEVLKADPTKWDQSVYTFDRCYDKHGCRSVACIAGHIVHQAVVMGEVAPIPYAETLYLEVEHEAATLFEITGPVARRLFDSSFNPRQGIVEFLEGFKTKATPEDQLEFILSSDNGE